LVDLACPRGPAKPSEEPSQPSKAAIANAIAAPLALRARQSRTRLDLLRSGPRTTKRRILLASLVHWSRREQARCIRENPTVYRSLIGCPELAGRNNTLICANPVGSCPQCQGQEYPSSSKASQKQMPILHAGLPLFDPRSMPSHEPEESGNAVTKTNQNTLVSPSKRAAKLERWLPNQRMQITSRGSDPYGKTTSLVSRR